MVPTRLLITAIMSTRLDAARKCASLHASGWSYDAAVKVAGRESARIASRPWPGVPATRPLSSPPTGGTKLFDFPTRIVASRSGAVQRRRVKRFTLDHAQAVPCKVRVVDGAWDHIVQVGAGIARHRVREGSYHDWVLEQLRVM
jgi:hypothetical protein